MVSGSRIGIIPVSSSAVVVQIAFEPDMAWTWSGWRMRKPTSAAGSQAGVSRQKDPAGPERGSEQSQRRRESSTVFMWWSFSAMVAPGMFRTPPVTIRPISPSQWVSTVWRVRLKRMGLPFGGPTGAGRNYKA